MKKIIVGLFLCATIQASEDGCRRDLEVSVTDSWEEVVKPFNPTMQKGIHSFQEELPRDALLLRQEKIEQDQRHIKQLILSINHILGQLQEGQKSISEYLYFLTRKDEYHIIPGYLSDEDADFEGEEDSFNPEEEHLLRKFRTVEDLSLLGCSFGLDSDVEHKVLRRSRSSESFLDKSKKD